jgi:hypothetical protein
LDDLIVDTNIFHMSINSKSIVYDAVNAMDDIIKSKHAIFVKSLFLSFFKVGGRCTFDT